MGFFYASIITVHSLLQVLKCSYLSLLSSTSRVFNRHFRWSQLAHSPFQVFLFSVCSSVSVFCHKCSLIMRSMESVGSQWRHVCHLHKSTGISSGKKGTINSVSCLAFKLIFLSICLCFHFTYDLLVSADTTYGARDRPGIILPVLICASV